MGANRKAVFLLRLLVSVALLWLLYRRVALSDVLAVFQSLRIWPLAAFFVLLFLNTAMHAFKWALLLRADGIHIRYRSLLASYLVGSFFNMFLPSNIGGDAYRVYDVAQSSKRTAHAFASVLADRISGYVALMALAALAGFAGRSLLPNPHVLWIPLAGLAGLALLIGFSFHPSWALELLGLRLFTGIYDLRPLAAKLLASARAYRSAPALFARIMLVSFVFQISVVVSIGFLTRGLDLSVPFHALLVVVPFVSILEALPISIFGLGIRDASYAYFLTHLGMPEAQALTVPLAYVVLTLVYVSTGGVIFLLRPRGKGGQKVQTTPTA